MTTRPQRRRNHPLSGNPYPLGPPATGAAAQPQVRCLKAFLQVPHVEHDVSSAWCLGWPLYELKE